MIPPPTLSLVTLAFEVGLTIVAAFNGWKAWVLLPWLVFVSLSVAVAGIITLATDQPASTTVMNPVREVAEGLLLTALVVMAARTRQS